MRSRQQRNNNPTMAVVWVAFIVLDVVALLLSAMASKAIMATYCLTIVAATDLIAVIVIGWGIHNCSKMKTTPTHLTISHFLTNYGLFFWAWAAYFLQPVLWQLTIIAVIAMVIIVSLNAGVVVHVFNCNNPSWLAGNDGRIGLANWLSITRMAASLVVPGIFGFQTFGDRSFLIGTATLICIQATDCLDGLAARKLGQVTKAGKYLDPLGDKAVFYPAAIAMLIGTQGHLGFIAPNTPLWPTVITLTVFIGGLAIGLTRDVLVVVWFKLEGTKLPQGISSSWLEKIRAVSMYVWLDSTALGLCTNGLPSSSFKAISFISLMIFSWILSPTTFFTGLYRVRTLQKELGLR